MVETMYRYYERQAILPTFANLADRTDFGAYESARRRLFIEKLHVPPRIFRSAEVLQYGPDTGEDALVFAHWGARLTVVEPNAAAIDVLRRYFSQFGLDQHLSAVVNTDLESYRADREFDFIDAEGFIYTIQPVSRWLECFRTQLKDDGLFLITANEATGLLVELCTKALYRAGTAR